MSKKEETLTEQLQAIADACVEEICARMAAYDVNATGDTSDSLTADVGLWYVKVYADDSIPHAPIGTLNWGSWPRGNKPPPLYPALLEWVGVRMAKGSFPDTDPEGAPGLAFAIYRSLKAKGTLLYQAKHGGADDYGLRDRDIYKAPARKVVREFKELLSKHFGQKCRDVATVLADKQIRE